MSDATTTPTEKEVKAADKIAERNETSITGSWACSVPSTRTRASGTSASDARRWPRRMAEGQLRRELRRGDDFKRLMNRIADESRVYVPIKNIEVGKYVRAYVFTVRGSRVRVG